MIFPLNPWSRRFFMIKNPTDPSFSLAPTTATVFGLKSLCKFTVVLVIPHPFITLQEYPSRFKNRTPRRARALPIPSFLLRPEWLSREWTRYQNCPHRIFLSCQRPGYHNFLPWLLK